MAAAYTVTQTVDGINGGKVALGRLSGRTVEHSTCLGIHQIYIGETHVRYISIGVLVIFIFTVDLVGGMRNKLLHPVTCTRTVGYVTSASAGGKTGILEFGIITFCLAIDILDTVKYYIMVEAGVTVLERILSNPESGSSRGNPLAIP